MKLFFKLLIAVFVISLMLPFTILKGRDGRPLMSLSDLKMPDFNLLGSADMPDVPVVPDSLKSISAGSETHIYQWYDKEGNIQFTNIPPPQGVRYTVKEYNPDTNVIQPVEIADEGKPELSKQVEAEEEVDTGKVPDGLDSVYSPEKIKKLFDDTKNVEKLLNNRFKQQDAILGD